MYLYLFQLFLFEKGVSKIRQGKQQISTSTHMNSESYAHFYVSKSLRAYIFAIVHILNQLK